MAKVYNEDKIRKYEAFVNDVLKEDLKKVHEQLEKKNSDIAEWIQLKTVLNTLKDAELADEFKTKMDIGTNIFVQVKVPDASKIFINVGFDIYVEYNIEEALKFLDKKIDLLNKEVDIIRNRSAEIKARIKLVLHGIQELSNIK